jgi:hypothetical protein
MLLKRRAMGGTGSKIRERERETASDSESEVEVIFPNDTDTDPSSALSEECAIPELYWALNSVVQHSNLAKETQQCWLNLSSTSSKGYIFTVDETRFPLYKAVFSFIEDVLLEAQKTGNLTKQNDKGMCSSRPLNAIKVAFAKDPATYIKSDADKSFELWGKLIVVAPYDNAMIESTAYMVEYIDKVVCVQLCKHESTHFKGIYRMSITCGSVRMQQRANCCFDHINSSVDVNIALQRSRVIRTQTLARLEQESSMTSLPVTQPLVVTELSEHTPTVATLQASAIGLASTAATEASSAVVTSHATLSFDDIRRTSARHYL